MHFFIHFNKATVSSSCKQHRTRKFVQLLNNINYLWEQLLGSGGRRYIREYNSKSTTKFQIIKQPHYLGLNQIEWFYSVITHLSHSTITGGSKNSGDKNIVPAEQIKFITCIIKEDNWSKHLKVSILRRIKGRQTTFSMDSQIFFTFTVAYTFTFAVTYE